MSLLEHVLFLGHFDEEPKLIHELSDLGYKCKQVNIPRSDYNG
jgi:hypothetical protein